MLLGWLLVVFAALAGVAQAKGAAANTQARADACTKALGR